MVIRLDASRAIVDALAASTLGRAGHAVGTRNGGIPVPAHAGAQHSHGFRILTARIAIAANAATLAVPGAQVLAVGQICPVPALAMLQIPPGAVFLIERRIDADLRILHARCAFIAITTDVAETPRLFAPAASRAYRDMPHPVDFLTAMPQVDAFTAGIFAVVPFATRCHGFAWGTRNRPHAAVLFAVIQKTERIRRALRIVVHIDADLSQFAAFRADALAFDGVAKGCTRFARYPSAIVALQKGFRSIRLIAADVLALGAPARDTNAIDAFRGILAYPADRHDVVRIHLRAREGNIRLTRDAVFRTRGCPAADIAGRALVDTLADPVHALLVIAASRVLEAHLICTAVIMARLGIDAFAVTGRLFTRLHAVVRVVLRIVAHALRIFRWAELVAEKGRVLSAVRRDATA